VQTSTGPGTSTGGAASSARHLARRLRIEGAGGTRDAVAIGIGVFVGCVPIYGLHLIVCWVLGWALRLNRLKMYLAANISNPLMAPLLILAELQIGAWIQRRDFHDLTLETVRATDPWVFGADIVIGSLILGATLGPLTGFLTWLSTRKADPDPVFSALTHRAADRYVSSSITAWEFARGKMRRDPLYRTVLRSGILPSGGLAVDVGCGQGLMLALLAEGAADWRRGTWPEPEPPPIFESLIGIETRARVAALARRALAGDATVVTGDARTHALQRCRAVFFFDVLHLLRLDDQERMLMSAARALEPGGVILVREADAAAGRRFGVVKFGNRLKAILFGNWTQTFHFRSTHEWTGCFRAAGFDVQTRSTGEGTPFGNVLFVLTRQVPGPG
jgi:uncharacterized protein (DUF2062 family)